MIYFIIIPHWQFFVKWVFVFFERVFMKSLIRQ